LSPVAAGPTPQASWGTTFLEENFMKITINTRKPRNPLVAPAHFRRAGLHQPRGGSMRQQAGRALRRELDQFKQHSP
jgi:hypothetical protein